MKHDHSSFTAQTTAKRAYGTDATARIAQFMPMVRKLAWYYESSCGGSLDVDDLQQAGLIALTECAQRHDRPNDDGFAAYAKMRVRGAMIDLLRSQSNLARGAAALGRRIERAVDHLLDDFADALDPMYGTWQAKEDRPGFDRYLTDHADQATEALLSITDEKSERAESKIIRSTYKTLRGQAHKHVIDALPGVGRLIERHAPAQPDAT